MPPKDRGRYKLPVPLPKDMILKDTEGKVWRLGSQIGQGGFGLIYLASPQTHIPVEDDAVHVIKVEYLENGPLFSELKFYQRAAKLQHIRKWMNLKNIRCLGIPVFWGSGLAEYKGKSYRFMVMERLGEDLQRIFEDCGGRFKKETVLQLGARILDTLEYIHENEYVHGDIKAANLLLGYTNPHEVYLADYGLSYRYCPNGNHKQYQENPRKGHNGTIKFTSLDAHKGVAEGCGFRKVLFTRSHLHTHLPVCDGFALVSQEMAGRSAWEREAPSRRGDLEILGYCMLQWLCGKLPWEQNLNDPVAVQTAKTKLMDELPHSVLEWDSSGRSCGEISKFLACVYGLAYDEKPKYEVLKQILLDGLESSGTRYDGPLEFSAAACTRNHSAAKASKRFFRPWFLAVEDIQGLVHFGAAALTPFADRQALPTASLHGTVCRYPGADSFHLGPLHSLSTSPFIHQTLLPLKRQPKNSGSHYKQSAVSSLLAYEQKVTPDDLSDSTSTSLVHRKEVWLPKPMPKPVQQKQKKMESDEHVYQNQACMGVTSKQLHDEEKPSQLNRMVRQAEPQQVPIWKPSPKPVHQKQTKVKEEETNGLSRPRAGVTRRLFQAEATPVKFHTTAQEPDHPPKKDTARELPPFDPQALFSESKKTPKQLFTTDHHPLSSQGAGSGITRPPLWSILRLAFTEETYHYTIAILLLLPLIVLSLYFL